MEHSRKRWFKSAFKLGTGNKVSKSDMKKLRSRINVDAGGILDEQLKAVKIIGEKTILYCSQDDEPMFFQFQQNGELFPTVYAMWLNEGTFFVPMIVISKLAWQSIERGFRFYFLLGFFSNFFRKGSDLFVPGVHGVIGQLKKGKAAAVVVDGCIYGVGVRLLFLFIIIFFFSHLAV